jgi:hypothetical protein
MGQASKEVKCVYFVAKGTLDEPIWRLIEKKFADLGEFIDGNEDAVVDVHGVCDTRSDVVAASKRSEGERTGPTSGGTSNPVMDAMHSTNQDVWQDIFGEHALM